MITSEHAQAARSDGQRLVKTKFSTEISDWILRQGWGVISRPRIFFSEISFEIVQYMAHALGEIRILQAHAQFVIGNFVQNGDGIMIKVLPPTRREFLEDFLCFLVPGPPKISGTLAAWVAK